MNISSINLKSLPDIEKLKSICKSIAMLDAIICQEWEYRYYSFNSNWFDNEMMASMRNGQGSHYFILFFNKGAIIKGFDIDAPIKDVTGQDFWENKIKQIPDQFEQFLREPAFVTEEATFFIWRLNKDSEWHTLNIGTEIKGSMADISDFDGSQHLITILSGLPETYKKWADAYYESNFDLDIIKKIYRHEPLTKEMVEVLNSEIDFKLLTEDIKEIGYPCNKISL